MKEKNFKFRESFGNLVENMTDKQAGEFIKALSGYVFKGKPMESKDEYLKGVFLYAQNILDVDMQNRENGKIGGTITAEKMRNKTQREQVVSKSSVVSEVIMVTSGESGKAAENKNGMSAKPIQRQSCCVTKSSSISKSIAK